MNRTPLHSSNLAAVGYDAQRKVLEVEFNDGSVYEYAHVPVYLHKELMVAKSHGTFLDAFIKKGGYPHRWIE